MIRDPRPAGSALLILALVVAGIMLAVNLQARGADLQPGVVWVAP
jgi:hypothetical protein